MREILFEKLLCVGSERKSESCGRVGMRGTAPVTHHLLVDFQLLLLEILEMTDSDPKTTTEAKAEVKSEVQETSKDAGGGGEAEAETHKDMRAVVLNGFGGLKSVKIVRRAEPSLADGEVLVRVHLW